MRNGTDHLAARDWVTIENPAPFAAVVHPIVPGFLTPALQLGV
jgi:hypothetical protein